MSKLLITSGCSFSECVVNHLEIWPKHLVNELETWPKHLLCKLENNGYKDHYSFGMRSQGNGLISRGIMYQVTKALETYKPEDILVGVMWSHSNRFDYRCEDPSLLSWGNKNKHYWKENPRNIVDGAPKNWVIGNKHWDSIEFSTYFKYYYSNIGASILSLEHILRTQYFLKSKEIKYFFTDFVDDNIFLDTDKDNIELKYLINELDKDQYLPVSSEHGWLIENSETKEDFIKEHLVHNIKHVHPNTQQHEEFVNKIIYPWLQEKGYV